MNTQRTNPIHPLKYRKSLLRYGLRFLPVFFICVLLLAACAAPQAATVVKTVEAEKVVTTTEQPTAAPAEPKLTTAAAQPAPTTEAAVQATSTTAAAQATPIAQATQAGTLPPSPTQPSLPTTIPPTLVTPVEGRIVQVEWPERIRMGESDVVRLALVPSEQGYTLTTEFPEHQTITQTVSIARPGGYDLFAVARLDGVGFEIAPQGEQAQYLPPDQALGWRWSLMPRNPGQQRLSVTLILRWIPNSGQAGQTREVIAYSRGLDVRVLSFLGLSRTGSFFTGMLGLVFGSGLSLFAIFMRPYEARRLLARIPNPQLTIELPNGLSLLPQERSLLQSLFQRYGRLVIEQEFLSGYSGARTFLALPIRPDGRADAYTIAKLGEQESIRSEFANYETFVKDTLPPITARIQHPPVTTPAPSPEAGVKLAALQYTFIGEPGATPTSLRQALLADPDPRLLHKLFDTFGPNWWLQRRPYTFRLALEYDQVLPTHLVIEPARGAAPNLDGRTPPGEVRLKVGQTVTLRNFPRLERRADGRSLSLQGLPAAGQPPLRVRWLSRERPEGVAGRVVDTRQTLLSKFAEGCDLLGLPDPLPRLPDLLSETLSGSQSTIHGDLNLENVLVGPGDMLWLIDFAQTRDGHTLIDFAHLETEIIAHILAPQIASPQEYLALLCDPEASPYARLHSLRQALHEIASRCLFNPSQPREYHLALALACLGALKYGNLDQHARQLLYITGAYLIRDL